MSMLKCGQKNNLNYTYGMKIEDIDSENETINTIKVCKKCKAKCDMGDKICSACGESI